MSDIDAYMSTCGFTYSLPPTGFDWECNRTPHDESEKCIFHSDDADPDEVTSQLKEEIHGGRSDFFGANIPSVSLTRMDLTSVDYLYFTGATIEKLRLSETRVTATLVLDDADVKLLDFSGSQLDFNISAISASIDECDFEHVVSNSRISFDEATISDMNFSDADVRTLEFNSVELLGDCNLFSLNAKNLFLTGSSIAGDFSLTSARIGEIHAHQVTFDGDVISRRSTFQQATHFQLSSFASRVDFSLSTLGGDVDFRQTRFCDGADFSRCEISVSNFTDIHASDNLDFSNADFNRDIRISMEASSDCDVHFDDGTFFNDLFLYGDSPGVSFLLTGVDIQGDFDVHRLEADSLKVPLSHVHSRIAMSEVFLKELSFSNTHFSQFYRGSNLDIENFDMHGGTFDADFYLADSVVGNLSLGSSNSNAGLVIQECTVENLDGLAASFSELHFHETDIVETIRLDNSKVDYFHSDIQRIDHPIFVSLVDSTIESGVIEHPGPDYAIFDFTSTTIGDVDVHGPESMNPLGPFQFVEADFKGFDFADFRESLESTNWLFDDTAVSPSGELGTISPDELPEESIDKRRYPELTDPLRSKQITYLKAKHGANLVGDNRAASEFFIKEMRFERKRIIKKLSEEFPPVSTDQPYLIDFSWFSSAGDVISNITFDISSGYGERLRRIGGWTGFTILFSAIAYALVGGVQNSATGADISTSPLSIEAFSEALYFSIVTFTTLGYGDYKPITGAAKFIAGLESLVGAFIVGVFVYSLGKQISR